MYLKSLVSAFSGKKTYIVSALIVAEGVDKLVQQHHWSAIAPYLLTGAFGVTIRQAVAKVEAKLPASVDAQINKVV